MNYTHTEPGVELASHAFANFLNTSEDNGKKPPNFRYTEEKLSRIID